MPKVIFFILNSPAYYIRIDWSVGAPSQVLYPAHLEKRIERHQAQEPRGREDEDY